MHWRGLGGGLAITTAVALSVVVGAFHPTAASADHWSSEHLQGTTRLTGEVPLSVSDGIARYVGPHARSARITLNFGFPLRERTQLDALIAHEAATHQYLSRDQIYARYSPPSAQLGATTAWLKAHGFRITHVSPDRLAVAASATTAQIERALHVQISDYVRPASTFHGLKVKAYSFYANTSSPLVPARLGFQTISGLTNVDRFYTDVQLGKAAHGAGNCSDDDNNGPVNPLCVDVRSGGYFPSDLKSLYDVSGHGFDGTGQTLGFTLWTAAERQLAMTTFAAATGDTPITVDPSCVATGNSPTSPSSCVTQTVAGDHLMTVYENGNNDLNVNFGSNVETALDIEQAHGIATHAGLKYYASECAANPAAGSGLANGGCNGTDVGLEEAVEDAANDPTLHTVSNSWGYGGDAEWGNSDPFVLATSNSLAIAAAAGTTFYFSTGDNGTYESGYPADSPYVVAVGGTTLFSTANTGVLSTEETWAAGGSWCSNVIGRPAWQTGAGVSANAPCPGRSVPDVSAIADTNSSVRFVSTSSPTGTQSGGVGGTSVAAPEMNGLEAVTENFLAAQTYSGGTPQIGFEGPMLYQLGNSSHYDSYFRDVVCGNTASPSGGPDGDAALTGWDSATGFGAPDWFQFATGYAIALGATNLSTPGSLSRNYSWACAKTPGNASERSISFPTSSTGYAVGAASGATPWPAKFLPSGAWGAVNTFYKSTDGGKTWFPSNGDMMSISCASSSSCVEVGDGGRVKQTSDGGTTWSDASTPFNKALTQVQCPSATVCYAAGDRGAVLKSSDGGATWGYLQSTDGNPIYGLACPTASTCYATDLYAHVVKTTDGGASWTWQQTPITTPGADVAPSGGPNPFGGLLSISCSSATSCVATGLYATVAGQTPPSSNPPIVTTIDGGATWTLRTSNAGQVVGSTTTLSAATAVGATNIKVASVSAMAVGLRIVVDNGGANPETVTVTAVGTAGASGTGVTFTPALGSAHASAASVGVINAPGFLHAVSCLSGTTICTAVGRGGDIVTTSNLATWTPATSNTANLLDGVSCLSTSFCMAVGQNGTVDTWNGSTWTAKTGVGGTGILASVTCLSTTTCFTAGKQGVTLVTTDGGATWTQQAGGGTTQQMNSVSCPSAAVCFAVGNAGTILATANGGQSWLAQTSNTTNALNGVSCTTATSCLAVGAAGVVRRTVDGSTWTTVTSGTANALTGVACAATCVAVGAAGTIVSSPDGGTWTVQASGTTAGLTAVTCVTGACYATGAAVSGNAVMLRSADSGTTWAAQTSNSNGQALNGIACLDAANCFASGAIGTLVTTTDGQTWRQQGNPLSGPTSALNVTASAIVAANAVACTTLRCFVGTGSSGNIMTSPLLTVIVHSSSAFGSTPGLSGLAPTDPAISYAPASEAANVTGSLTCSTTATATSDAGTFPVAACSGLADNGYSVVYDYADSSNTVTPAAQTITFGPLPDATFGDADFTVGATATSGLAVTFSASGSCTVSGTTVSITHGGSCTVTASQPGNNDWQAAADVSQTFAIAKADQTITFATPSDQTFGDPDFEIDATSTSGLPVSLAVDSGRCTLSTSTSPAQLHLLGAGTCTIRASQAGNGDYNAADDQARSFSIAMENQSITFGALGGKTFGDADFSVSATASSGLAVSFAAAGNCTISGSTVHITGAGSCSVTASQPGNVDWNPAGDVTQSFAIAQEAQAITFDAIADHTFGDADFTVSPSAASGLPVSLSVASGSTCTLSGSTVHITGAGTCSLTASQPGDANWAAAPSVTRTFTIAQEAQTITFAAIPNHTFGDADFAIAPTASSGLPVSLAVTAGSTCGLLGQNVHITGAGTCTITATQAGNANWSAAPPVPQSFTIAKEGQTITFTPIANKPFGAPDFEVNAFATSRLQVTFTATGVCTLSVPTSPSTVHLTGTGTCTITASQAGDGNWNAAASVTRSFSVQNSTDGSADGDGLQPSNGGHAEFHVDANPPGRKQGPDGTLVYDGPQTKPVKGKPTPAPVHFEAKTITAFGIADDGKSAWIAGTGRDGRSFLAYVEDNDGLRWNRRHDSDVFQLWIAGTLQTGDGSLDQGRVSIATPRHRVFH